MHKTTTSIKNENDVLTKMRGPQKATIEFLKQFARAYEYNAELPKGLEAIIMN